MCKEWKGIVIKFYKFRYKYFKVNKYQKGNIKVMKLLLPKLYSESTINELNEQKFLSAVSDMTPLSVSGQPAINASTYV